MREPRHNLPRRHFLKTGGAGLAAWATAPWWSGQLDNVPLPIRSKPARPIFLRSEGLQLLLDRTDGLPYEYSWLETPARFRGEAFGEKIRATLCRLNPRGFLTAALSSSSVRATATQADFHFEARYENQPGAEFVLRYVVDGPAVLVSMEDVQEKAGFELIDVALPSLASLCETDGEVWLAHGNDGGSLAKLAEARTAQLPENRFWGRVLASLPLVMIGTERAICVLETTSYMDGTKLAVSGASGQRCVSLGTIKTHRVNGSLCYDLNLNPPNSRICGNDQTPNLLVGQRFMCRLDFVGDFDGDGKVDWLDGAKLLRARTPRKPTTYYDDKFEYGIHLDEPRWQEPGATFPEAADLIRKVAALTDHSPQVVQLWGWQYRGKDTGYPAVAEVNARIGGYDGLMRLMEEGRKYNCTVTFSDNFDDAYKSSPAWDPAIIARRPDGELWESRNWTGENSYIVGMAKYMKGPGKERVRYTCDRYKLRDTTHVDVLSYYSIRNDWDPTHPASGIKNLEEGRYKVLEGFKERGVDVSSEALRYAFIGKVTWFNYADGLSRAKCPFGGGPVPILPLVYRQAAIWGGGGRALPYPDRILDSLFWNTAGRIWLTKSSNLAEVTDLFYLVMVPWSKIQSLNIESFRRDGDKVTIGLERNSVVVLNMAAKTYSVKLAGVEIARNGSTFCPLDEAQLAFYALNAGEVSAALPAGWNSTRLAAIALDVEKPEELHAETQDGTVKVTISARRPVIVYRDGDSARKRLLRTYRAG